MATADDLKNEEYWMKRRKNNEAARRSREKRRMNDLLLERRVIQLTEENKRLKAQLQTMRMKHGETDNAKYPQSTFGDDVDSDLLGFSEKNIFQSNSCKSNFDLLGSYQQRSPKDYDFNSNEECSSRKFTSQVFTNATGDTSATVLVNSTDFSTKYNTYPRLDLNDRLSKYIANMTEPDQVEVDNSATESIFPFTKQQHKTSKSIFCESGSRNDKLTPSGVQSTVADLLDPTQELPLSSKSSAVLSKELLGDLYFANNSANRKSSSLFSSNSFLDPSILKLFREYHSKSELQMLNSTSTPQLVPTEELFQQQIQNHLIKLHSTIAAVAAIDLYKINKTYNDLSQRDSANHHRINLPNGFNSKSSTSHQQSIKAKLSLDERNNTQEENSPLSPPPSPEQTSDHLSNFSLKIKSNSPNNLEESTNSFNSIKESRERSSIAVLNSFPESNKGCLNLAKTKRPHSTSALSNDDSSSYDSKGMLEHQLPHKLRLKRASLKEDNSNEVNFIEKKKENPSTNRKLPANIILPEMDTAYFNYFPHARISTETNTDKSKSLLSKDNFLPLKLDKSHQLLCESSADVIDRNLLMMGSANLGNMSKRRRIT